jgi:hypothetical protein
MNEGDLYKDGPQRIKELLFETFGDDFKEYFLGEPAEIGQSQLPCVMIAEKAGRIESDATGLDRVTETVQITLALNKLDDVGARQDQILTERRLQALVKGQDPETGHYLPGTVAYALRHNFTLKEGAIDSYIETDFDINVRGDNTYTQEAYVTVYITRLVVRT